jgi:hypothetical protein
LIPILNLFKKIEEEAIHTLYSFYEASITFFCGLDRCLSKAQVMGVGPHKPMVLLVADGVFRR